MLQILISYFGAKDQLVWCPEPHGNFSVRSAYKIAQHDKEAKSHHAETSHAREDRKWMWRKL